MSKPIFSDLYSISTRRNRKSYILFFLLIYLANLIAIFLFHLILAITSHGGTEFGYFTTGFVWISLIVAFVAYTWWTVVAITVSLQRYNDLSWQRKWFELIYASFGGLIGVFSTIIVNFGDVAESNMGLFIPVFILLALLVLAYILLAIMLIFVPGQKGENQYGLNPLDEFAVIEEKPKT